MKRTLESVGRTVSARTGGREREIRTWKGIEGKGTAWPGPYLPVHLPPYSERFCYLFMRLHPKGHKNCIRKLISLLSNGKLTPVEKIEHTTVNNTAFSKTQELVLKRCLSHQYHWPCLLQQKIRSLFQKYQGWDLKGTQKSLTRKLLAFRWGIGQRSM